MKYKILSLILIFAVVCSVFVISVSAQEEYVIKSGTYSWNDVINFPSNSIELLGDFSFPEAYSFEGMNVNITSFGVNRLFISASENSIVFNRVDSSGNVLPFTLGVTTSEGSETLSCILVQTFFGGFVGNVYSSTDFTRPVFALPEFSRTFIISSDIETDVTTATWFSENTTRAPDTGVISAGYYRLRLPIVVSNPSWIGDNNIVWYDMRGRIVTDTSNRAFSFYRLGIKYNELTDDNGIYNGFAIDIVINDYNHDEYDELLPYLEIYSVTYFADEDRYYYGYNDLVLDSFVGIALDGDYEVNEDFKIVFDDLFEPYDYVYTGNPWFDIVDGVVDALKIDVFGDFSPWDILITFIGISVFIWLLKLLAGG